MGARRKVATSIERAVARGSSRKITLDGPAEAVKGLRKSVRSSSRCRSVWNTDPSFLICRNTNLLDEIELKVGARVMVVQVRSFSPSSSSSTKADSDLLSFLPLRVTS